MVSFFERPDSGERAIIVHINFSREKDNEQLDEFIELVNSAGAETVAIIKGNRQRPEAKYFVGTGKAEEIRLAVQSNEADVVLVNHAISPAQERNLENLLECRVLDRTGVILDIFAQRARSFEGQLQVELAQLNHMSTRLVRGWTHLERQKGGIGMRGPGETQLETDRRLLSDRIKQLKKRLTKVQGQREQSRRSRDRAEIPTVSLIGYTNAGKSTLFNQLSNAKVYVEDKLFATLDPTLRRIELPGKQAVVLADTVGFIRHLPHDLISAFHATLQETREADLLLHIIDAHAPEREDNIRQVEHVVEQVDADKVPQILVYNKIDLLNEDSAKDFEPRIDRDEDGKVTRVWLSAKENKGLDLLVQAIREFFTRNILKNQIVIPLSSGKLRSRLYNDVVVLDEAIYENGDIKLTFECSSSQLQYLLKDDSFYEYLVKEE
ncbi:MAG: GTPase HflX [Pseudomonadota bacterium]